MHSRIQSVLFDALDELPENALRQDSVFRLFRDPFAMVRLIVGEELTLASMFAQMTRAAKSVDRHSNKQIKKTIETVTKIQGIPLRSSTPRINASIEQFRENGLRLIKSLGDREIDELREIMENGEGLRVEELRAQIQQRFDVTRSRADLLARDQVLKLHAEISQAQMESLGVPGYIWTSSGDERVRPIHAALDGSRQLWLMPPIVDKKGRRSHPGKDFQCRCTAFPIIPELL